MAQPDKPIKLLPAPRPTAYQRRVKFCYDSAALRRLMEDEELAEWRLVAAFSEAGGLQYVLIFEREV